MREYHMSREIVIENLRASMPPVGVRDDLREAKTLVLSSRTSSMSPAPRIAWRVSGAVAIAAALIASTVIALGPGQQPAFARDKAVAALAFQKPGSVLHAEMRFSTEERSSSTSAAVLREHWSLWADPDHSQMRQQFVLADGSLDELSVEHAGRSLTYLAPARYPQPMLVERDTSRNPLSTVLDDTVGAMRDGIATGRTHVVGTRMIDGQRCWVVEETIDDENGHCVETVIMRQSDYRPLSWSRRITSSAGDHEVLTKSVTFDTVEQIAGSALPDDFFSLDAVRAAKAANATTVNRP